MIRIISMSLLLLFAAAAPLHAQDQVCPGEDLLAKLSQSEPTVYKALSERAASAPNGEGIVWRVTRGDAPASLLFGTIHRSDPRVTALPDAVRKAIPEARLVFLELTQADNDEFTQTLQTDPMSAMAGDGPKFDDGFTDSEKKLAAEVLAGFGASYEEMRQLKPALVFALISFSPCTAMRLMRRNPIVDHVVEMQARAENVEVRALESADEQFEALGAGSEGGLREIMLASFAAARQADDYQETVLRAYLRGEVQMIWEFGAYATESLDVIADPDEVMAGFFDSLVTVRNINMADRAEAELLKGGVIVAVGALHLPGYGGLVSLLRERGFTVERVD